MNGTDPAISVAIAIFVIIIVVFIQVAILRWIFRINEQINHLISIPYCLEKLVELNSRDKKEDEK